MGGLGDYWREHRDHQRKLPLLEDDDDLGATFRAMRDSKKERHAENFKRHHEDIAKLGIPFDLKNEGHHVVFTFEKGKADFWPASGKWHIHKPNRYGHGLQGLLKEMRDSSG